VVDLSLYRNTSNNRGCADFHPQDLHNSPHHNPHPIPLHSSSSNLKLTEMVGMGLLVETMSLWLRASFPSYTDLHTVRDLLILLLQM
jgi:hypothetical protein